MSWASEYEGTCCVCKERYDVGDEIVHDDDLDAWVHPECEGGERAESYGWGE